MNSQLITAIHQVAQELPPIALAKLADAVLPLSGNSVRRIDLLDLFQNSNFQRVINYMIDAWQEESTSVNGQAISLALRTAAHSIHTVRKSLSVEIVWTGPDMCGLPIRRTEQVLLQLIQNAQQELVVISFAVYKVPEIAKALIDAMDRGITLTIAAETPEAGQEKVPFGVMAGLGYEVAKRARVFTWDRNKRPKSADGKQGSLHMKCVVVDRQKLFISSANLTEYAFTLNMEMGLLVHSQELASQAASQLDRLIQNNILINLPG